MADVKAKIRNKFNVDEELESPFDIKQLKRASTYVLRYKWRMLEAFGLSILSILVDLITPLYTTWIVDDMIPAKNIRCCARVIATYRRRIRSARSSRSFFQLKISSAAVFLEIRRSSSSTAGAPFCSTVSARPSSPTCATTCSCICRSCRSTTTTAAPTARS